MEKATIKTGSFHGGLVSAYLDESLIEDYGDIIKLTPSQWRKYCTCTCDRGYSRCACGGATITLSDGRIFGGGDGPWERSLSEAG